MQFRFEACRNVFKIPNGVENVMSWLTVPYTISSSDWCLVSFIST